MAAVPAAAALPDPAKVLLATRIQGLFLNDGLSLIEPGTAEVYRTTLEAARLILGGALANDILTPESHGVLTDMLDAAQDAPDVL
jgi:hypothetical protein